MYILILLTTLATATCLIFWVLRRPLHNAHPEQLRLALIATDRLLELLNLLQQYRGMSTAARGGVLHFSQELSKKQALIEKAFAGLMQDLAAEADEAFPCVVPQDVKLLRYQWQLAVTKNNRFSLSDHYAEQSVIVSHVLDWLNSFGKKRLLPHFLSLSVDEGSVKTMVHHYTQALPVLAEVVAQMRGYASYVAAQAELGTQESAVLRTSLQQAEAYLTTEEGAVEIYQHAGSRAQNIARQIVQQFINLVRREILDCRKIDLDPEFCFRMGSRAVDSVFNWIAVERIGLLALWSGDAVQQAVPAQPLAEKRIEPAVV